MRWLLIDVTDIGMTTKTRNVVTRSLNYFDVMHDILMTSPAGAFRNSPASVLHLDRLMKVTGGKSQGMKESVVRLGKILRDQAGWGVTVIASRNRPVTGFDPAIQMILHDMTVGARPWIVAEIGCTLGINEGVTTDAHRCSKCERDEDSEKSRRPAASYW
jgi:hypothetical protein